MAFIGSIFIPIGLASLHTSEHVLIPLSPFGAPNKYGSLFVYSQFI